MATHPHIFRREVFRSIGGSLGRFFAIMGIVALGCGFFAGLQMSGEDMRIAADHWYDGTNLWDLQILSTLGFADDDLERLCAIEGIEEVMPVKSVDVMASLGSEQLAVRISSIDVAAAQASRQDGPYDMVSVASTYLNRPALREGRWPETADECVVSADAVEAPRVGDVVKVLYGGSDLADILAVTSFRVVGTVSSSDYPYTGNFGSTTLGTGMLDEYLYVSEDAFAHDTPYTGIYARVVGAEQELSESDAYQAIVGAVKRRVEDHEATLASARRQDLKDEAQAQLDKKRADYEEEKARTQRKLNDAKRELDGSKTELDDAAHDLEEAKAQLDDAAAELADGKAQLDAGERAYKAGVAQLASQRRRAQDKLDDAQEQLEAGQRQIDEARAELQAQRQQFDEAQAAYDTGTAALLSKLAELGIDAETLEDARAQLSAAPQQLATSIDRLQETIDQLDAAIAEARASLEEAQASQPVDEAVVANLEEQLSTLDQQLTQARAAQDEAQQAKDALEDAQPMLEEKITQLEASQQSLDEARTDAEPRLAQAEADLNEQQHQLTAQREAYDQQRAEAEDQLAAAQRKLDDTRAVLDQSAQKLEAGQREYEKGYARYEEGRATYEDGRARYEDGLAEYRQGQDEAQRRFDDAEHELAKAQRTIDEIELPDIYLLDRTQSEGAATYHADAGRIDSIADVFPTIFFLVAALVSLTTMTRMVEDDRIEIGTYKALGYGTATIASKYLAYAAVASSVGAVVGILVLSQVLPRIIVRSYAIIYAVPLVSLPLPIDPVIACAAGALGVGVTLLATWLAVVSSLRETPATLMLPRVPKAGRRILLERVTPLWSRLSFSWKVTFRNLFRYKRRFLMTTIGIAGCAALLLVGFGLHDAIWDIIDNEYGPIVHYDTTIGLDEVSTEADVQRVVDFLKASGVGGDDGRDIVRAHEEHMRAGSTTYEGSLRVQVLIPQDEKHFSVAETFKDRQTQRVMPFGPDEVFVTEKTAHLLGIAVGDDIVLYHQDNIGNATGEGVAFTVTGIVENYVGNQVFVGREVWDETNHTKEDRVQDKEDGTQDKEDRVQDMVFSTLFVKTQSLGEEREQVADALHDQTGVSTVVFTDETIDQYRSMLSVVDGIVIVLIVSAAALATVVLYNLTNINIDERLREIASLKVLGFTRREVYAYIFREIALLAVIGDVVGMGVGTGLERFVVTTAEVDYVMFGRSIHLMSYGYAFLLTLLFTVLVLMVMRYKLDHVNMVESLKSVD